MTLTNVSETYRLLTEHHYLGPTKAAAFAWKDDNGCIVFAAPRARNLPHKWLEVVRWCIVGDRNAGSVQWSNAVPMIRNVRPDVTTIVSYSDPSAGHTGALYRACNWLWAPTWHRLRPPPTGNGEWSDGKQQSVKDRWIFPMKPDPDREKILTVNDASIMRSMSWASYKEPSWRRERFDPRTGGGDYKKWKQNEDAQRKLVDLI